jgi:predicted nucleotidyltransferase
MTLDLDALAAVFAADPRVVLAVLFGSAKGGTVRPGSDVDIGVLLAPALTPLAFFGFYVETTVRLSAIPELDLVDLNQANSILAFEALCGRRLFVRDDDRVAAFSSLVARQYEDDMLHATAAHAA